jgi:peroxiredoxin
MIELGELEAHHADFAKRNVQLVVASVDGQEDSQKTQAKFPDLLVVSDPKQNLVSAAEVLHPKAGPHGEDVAAPTTFVIDRQGKVQWLFRPSRVIERLSPADLLAAVDKHLAK